MLQAKAVVEDLLEWEVFKLVLILHFDFNLLVLLDVFESEIVFRQVDVRYTLVVFQILR